jgi:hypothetical protein
MRNRLRFFWLWLVREYEAANAYCFNCGKRGANVSSIMYPKRLCDDCATAACRRVDTYVKDILQHLEPKPFSYGYTIRPPKVTREKT